MKMNNRGQALVESAFLIPLMLLISVMIFWFCQIMLTRQQLIMAARYGTDLIVYTQLNEDQVREEVKKYLCSNVVSWRRLDPDRLTNENIEVRIYREQKLNSSLISGILKEIRTFGGSNEVENYSSYVEITYPFAIPRLFNAFERMFPMHQQAVPGIAISGRSEVLSGTGC